MYGSPLESVFWITYVLAPVLAIIYVIDCYSLKDQAIVDQFFLSHGVYIYSIGVASLYFFRKKLVPWADAQPPYTRIIAIVTILFLPVPLIAGIVSYQFYANNSYGSILSGENCKSDVDLARRGQVDPLAKRAATYYNRGYNLAKVKNLVEAKSYFIMARDMDPSVPDYHYAVCKVEFELSEMTPEAKSECDKTIQNIVDTNPNVTTSFKELWKKVQSSQQ